MSNLAIHTLEPAEYLGPMNGNLGLITNEATLPLGALTPDALKTAIWHEAYVKMAIWGSVLGAAGATIGYVATKRRPKKTRNAVLGGVGGTALGVGIFALAGWSRIKQAEAALSLIHQGVTSDPNNDPNLPLGIG